MNRRVRPLLPWARGNRPAPAPAREPGHTRRRSRAWPLVGIALAGFLFSISLHMSHLGAWRDNPRAFRDDAGLPLMTTSDSYYYLRLAADLANGRYHHTDELRPGQTRPLPAPLLSRLAATLHRVTGLPLETVALYVPPALASLLVIPLVLWGNAAGGPLAAFTAVLAGCSSFLWFSRTGLGSFDTDALNPFFALLTLYFTFRFHGATGRVRMVHLGAAIGSALLLGLWWDQVRPLGLILLAGGYALSVVLPSSRIERGIKVAILALGGLAILLALLGMEDTLPGALRHPVKLLRFYLELIVKRTGGDFPDVGQSIAELQPLPVRVLIDTLSGNLATFLLSLAGLLLLLAQRRDMLVFLLPLTALGAGAFFSHRLSIFAAPLCALGLARLVGEIPSRWPFATARTHWSPGNGRKERKKDESTEGVAPPPPPDGGGMEEARHSAIPASRFRRRVAVVASVMAAILLTAPGIRRCLSHHPRPCVTPGQVAMAKALKERRNDIRTVWNWWDEGFFIQYAAGRRTFIDGASQTPLRFHVAAFPLSTPDPVLANNWIEFFSAWDLAPLNTLSKQLGGMGPALDFLKEALAARNPPDEVARTHGVSEPSAWRGRLFPNPHAALALSSDMIEKAYWWFYFGSWDVRDRKGNHAIVFKFNAAEWNLDQARGALSTAGGKSAPVGRVIDIRGNSIVKTPLRQDVQTVLIRHHDFPTWFLCDESLSRSTAMRLLFEAPDETPPFRRLFHHPAVGGVWALTPSPEGPRRPERDRSFGASVP